MHVELFCLSIKGIKQFTKKCFNSALSPRMSDRYLKKTVIDTVNNDTTLNRLQKERR